MGSYWGGVPFFGSFRGSGRPFPVELRVQDDPDKSCMDLYTVITCPGFRIEYHPYSCQVFVTEFMLLANLFPYAQ